MRGLAISAVCLFSFLYPALALEPETEAAFVRVIDTGPALCCVVRVPDAAGIPHFMVYDAGHPGEVEKAATLKAVKELIPPGTVVDLLVLSHSDADHIGAVDELCETYSFRRIIHTGFGRHTRGWKMATGAIALQRMFQGAKETNLENDELFPGSTLPLGRGWLTVMAGLFSPPDEWGLEPDTGDWRNAGSIVIKLTYGGRKVLFCGDAVGRNDREGLEPAIATERRMLDFAEVVSLKSDVIIAPHHGSDDASSREFIAAVDPSWVVFSSGHAHHHPRQTTADRYLDHGIPAERMLRTDRGDNEGGTEWSYATSPYPDPVGDDDVDILIRPNGELLVEYR